MSAHRRRNEEIPLDGIREPRERYGDIFRQYDRDRDGRISIGELQNIIRSPEYRIGDIPDATVMQIMDFSDRDKSGYLDEEKFTEMILHPACTYIFQNALWKYARLVVPPRRRRVTGGLDKGEYSCWPAILCLITISLVEIVLFSYDALVEQNKSGTGPVATRLIYDPHKRYEVWRFISYMFVHVGSAHLVVNLFVQLLLGIPLGMEHCWWRVVLVYLAGVASGSLGTSVTDPGVSLAGASGGVYALIAAHLPILFMNWSKMEYAIIQFIVLLNIIIMDVGIAVYNRYYSGLDQNIGYESHCAGAIAGLLVGIGVLQDLKVKTWEKKLWWCAVVTYFVLTTTAVFINIFWTDHFPADYK